MGDQCIKYGHMGNVFIDIWLMSVPASMYEFMQPDRIIGSEV